MLKEFRFAFYAIRKNVENSAELRTSFLMNIFGMTINNTAFVAIWIFFIKSVGVINGWTPADIVGLMGFAALGFGIVFSVGYGIRKLPEQIANGAFDRFLLSPKNLLNRVSTSVFSVSSIGDILFGIVCLIIYGYLINAGAEQVFIIFLLVVISAIVHFSMAVMAVSISFLFSSDASAVSESVFQFFMTPSLFHGGAFQGGMRLFFTFIVPALVVGTLPVETVRDMSLEKLLIIVLVAVFWSYLAIKLFYVGVRRYESSNFMTFGN